MDIKEKKKKVELTEREFLILKFIAAGYSDLEIAQFLKLANSTLRRSIDVLYRKTDVCCRASLVAWGFRNNYLN
jgi:DNA-binding NarL/FixJ family response regulator